MNQIEMSSVHIIAKPFLVFYSLCLWKQLREANMIQISGIQNFKLIQMINRVREERKGNNLIGLIKFTIC